ncbi:MAG: Flp family type IVb pilin [Armatimonadota bacterium]
MHELWRDESGVTTVEYALLLALIVAAGLLAWNALGGSVRDSAQQSADTITNGWTP